VAALEARNAAQAGKVDIVFIGSSSILKWTSLKSDMAPYRVVNQGFGGSKIGDSVYYHDRLVAAYGPKAIVIFAGTNDLNGLNATSKTAEAVFEGVKAFYATSRPSLPEVPVYYISIIPTAARWNAWPEARKANGLVIIVFSVINCLTHIVEGARSRVWNQGLVMASLQFLVSICAAWFITTRGLVAPLPWWAGALAFAVVVHVLLFRFVMTAKVPEAAS